MIKTKAVMFSHICRIALAAIACTARPTAFAYLPGPGPGNGQALAQAGVAPPDFAMAAQESPFRSVAEEFVAAAAAGDRAKTVRMLSPAIAAKTGREGVERFLTGEVLPFFAPFKEVAGSVSVTRTADVTGFAFYMYMVSKAGELSPFVIYVIEEGGAKVVANVLVDRLVEGRHCLRVAAGWKCPDFG
jgi:hypothetical protein